MSTKLEAAAALKTLHGFIGRSQMKCFADLCRGEEKEFFFDKAVELARIVATMPKLYAQEGRGEAALVHLHYFRGNQDWRFTELDAEEGLAFGWANLGDDLCAEYGYTSIPEITACGVELDFYFKPKTLAECLGKPAPVAVCAESLFDLA